MSSGDSAGKPGSGDASGATVVRLATTARVLRERVSPETQALLNAIEELHERLEAQEKLIRKLIRIATADGE
jgi:hypothetical protein